MTVGGTASAELPVTARFATLARSSSGPHGRSEPSTMPTTRRGFAHTLPAAARKTCSTEVAGRGLDDGVRERRAAAPSAAAALAALACLVAAMPLPAQESADSPADTASVDGLLWHVAADGGNVAWDAARDYCETLEHAGFDDWRLPTLAELERLHDPSRDSGLSAPLALGDCCLWSSTSLVDEPAEPKGELPDPANDPADYYWGFLFPSGARYYSFRRFPDGLAACVREPDPHQ